MDQAKPLGRPKNELTEIKEQAKKLAMGYKIERVHEERNNNNTVISRSVEITEVPGSADALILWKSMVESG
ncbi:MAG: hypothetical protein IIB17_11500 [Chloroflexi bacterium]|nr:hypothetical protein [Chloroflexota bacterium]